MRVVARNGLQPLPLIKYMVVAQKLTKVLSINYAAML